MTGASRGIGRAVALDSRARAPGDWYGNVRGRRCADRRSLQDAGLEGSGEVLNVTDAAACEALLARIEKGFGAVSILVNNAGITRDNLAMRMKDDEWDAVIDTNLKSVFRMSRLVMRGMMKARGGRIINITSVVASREPRPGQLCGCQGGRRRNDAGVGPGARQSQYHGQLRSPRIHRYRHDESPLRRQSRAWSDRLRSGARPAGGDRCRGCLPSPRPAPATLLETRCT